MNITEEQIEQLKRLATKKTTIETNPDDWNPYDLSGGNFDDAYQIGYDDAEIDNARFILDILEIPY
jgi:hypothetical protein